MRRLPKLSAANSGGAVRLRPVGVRNHSGRSDGIVMTGAVLLAPNVVQLPKNDGAGYLRERAMLMALSRRLGSTRTQLTRSTRHRERRATRRRSVSRHSGGSRARSAGRRSDDDPEPDPVAWRAAA